MTVERENAPEPDAAACPPLTEAERAQLADEATQTYLKAYRESNEKNKLPRLRRIRSVLST